MLRSQVRAGSCFLLVALASMVAGCGDDDPVTPIEAEVTVRDFEFDPTTITVAPSATVTWTWDGTTAEPHNVTFDSQGITSSTDRTSGTFQATMPQTAGTYSYECTIHPNQMQGSVTVS